MAYAKKASKNEAYQKLKTDLKEGNPLGNAYLFYGQFRGEPRSLS